MTNHPVHIQDENGNYSPTALIPFCQFGFGENKDSMGGKSEKFNVSFCNSFKAKIIKDQLCYTVDPSKFMKDLKIKSKDEISLSLYINYNEDRQFSPAENGKSEDILIETMGKYNVEILNVTSNRTFGGVWLAQPDLKLQI